MTTTIRRMKFTQVDESLVDERVQLASQAQSVLGYHKLARALTVPGALLFTLRKLQIEPLVQSSVEAYKLKKARPGMWSGHKRGTVYLTISLLAGFVVAPLLNRDLDWGSPHLGCFGVAGAMLLAAGMFITCLCKFFDSSERGSRSIREWKQLTLSRYESQGGTIPEYVLSKAIQIKQTIPEVELTVDHLFDRTETISRPTRDPFLVATLGTESLYIDVWDEKEYEAKL